MPSDRSIRDLPCPRRHGRTQRTHHRRLPPRTVQATFAALGAKYDLTVDIWLATGCPWEDGLVVQGSSDAECITRQRQLYDIALPRLRPDAVVVMNDAYDDPSYPRTIGVGADLTPTDPALAPQRALPTALPRMMTFTHRLVIVHPWPSLSFDQRDCLASVSYVGECRAIARMPIPSDDLLSSTVAATRGVSILNLDRAICPRLPVCDALVDGEVVRRDGDHLDYRFVPHIVSELERQLLKFGVLT